MSGLKFYPKSHRYKLDGQWVQGVTTLIKGGLPAPALMYWSARTVAEFVADRPDEVEQLRQLGRGPMIAALKETPWQARDEAGVKGTDVHAIAERLVTGEAVEYPEHLTGYVEACVDFLDTWQIKPILVEAAVGHRRWQYAGTLDLVADHACGPRAIFDYKTARSGIFPETAFQLNAYARAEFYVDPDDNEHPMEPVGIQAAYGVHLRADGYDVYPLEFSDRVFNEFLHIAYVAKTTKRMKGYVGDATYPDQQGSVA